MRGRRLFPFQHRDRAVLQVARRKEHERVLSGRPQYSVVAGGNVDGCHDVRSRYALDGGWYVTLSDDTRKALSVVRKAQQADQTTLLVVTEQIILALISSVNTL